MKQAIKHNCVLVFAYGSNMSSLRLKERSPSARRIAIARLITYKLGFNKKSKKDNSTKANIFKTDDPNDFVWGVIYEISKNDKSQLDKHEEGYEAKEVQVLDSKQNYFDVVAYMAISGEYLNEDDLLYDWYKEYVIKGGEENDLPKEYLDTLKGIKFKIDPDEERRRTNFERIKG